MIGAYFGGNTDSCVPQTQHSKPGKENTNKINSNTESIQHLQEQTQTVMIE